MPRIFQEPNYGVTERSLEWVRRYKSDLGPLFRIRCFIHPHRVAGLEGDQWVEFEDQAGNKIIATGSDGDIRGLDQPAWPRSCVNWEFKVKLLPRRVGLLKIASGESILRRILPP